MTANGGGQVDECVELLQLAQQMCETRLLDGCVTISTRGVAIARGHLENRLNALWGGGSGASYVSSMLRGNRPVGLVAVGAA